MIETLNYPATKMDTNTVLATVCRARWKKAEEAPARLFIEEAYCC